MKHTAKITFIMLAFFLLSQFIGLLVVDKYIDHKKTAETKAVSWEPLPYSLERPEIENQSSSFIYIFIAIIIGTTSILFLMKFNKPLIWKIWFFVTVWIVLAVALAAFVNSIIALVLALALAILKIRNPNIITQNVSEIFIYGGLASFFVPILNLFAAFMLLALISIYDFIAVYKTKHMIKLAKFQSRTKVFAGLMIPYKINESPTSLKGKLTESKQSKSVAVLGGGDIGFTLIFAGVVMKALMLKEAYLTAFMKSLIIPLFATVALAFILFKGEKGKFYPAMPALSIGCVVGYLIILIL